MRMIKQSIIVTAYALLLISCGSNIGVNEMVQNSTSLKTKTAISSDGVAISYGVIGADLPVLVFVHGWSSDRTYWRHQIDQFSENYTVLNIDLAGHGESGVKRDNWTMQAFGQDVVAVVKQENATKIVLVGHSMGGQVILEAARLLGDRVALMIGIDTLQQPNEGLSHIEAETLWSGVSANFMVATEGIIRASMFLPDSNPQVVDAVVKDMISAPQDIAISAGLQFSQYNLLQGLQETDPIPLALINSQLTPTDLDTYKTIRSNVLLTVLENNGHFPMLETPSDFNSTLQGVLDEYFE